MIYLQLQFYFHSSLIDISTLDRFNLYANQLTFTM